MTAAVVSAVVSAALVVGLGAGLVAVARAGPVRGIIVDQVVAVVDKEVITDSELLVEARIALVMREREVGRAIAEGELDTETVLRMRDYLVNQLLIASFIRRLGTVAVSEQEVDRALQRFIQIFPTDHAYRAFKRKYDIPEAIIRGILRRELRNETYVKERMRSWLTTGLSEAERERRAKESLARWLEDLRRGAEVRLLGPQGELELQ